MSQLDMTIGLAVAGLPADHSAVRAAAAEFGRDLRDTAELAGGIRERPVAETGGKGLWSEVVLSLTGPAATAAAVRLVHLWLSRDQRRSITMTAETRTDGVVRATRTITVQGENLSEETVRQAIAQLDGK